MGIFPFGGTGKAALSPADDPRTPCSVLLTPFKVMQETKVVIRCAVFLSLIVFGVGQVIDYQLEIRFGLAFGRDDCSTDTGRPGANQRRGRSRIGCIETI